MNYLSVCSGIEAATVAWHHMGWNPVGFSEIEKFPSQVLAHHYPQVTNFGDMTKYKEWQINDPIGLLVGGTPCQSFSVAGLRKGLEDPRGNLALTYVGILDHFRPKWFIWENVPGVLSSGGGRDFGSFLGALGELGYGWSYRVLDAQYFGVAQRRRRVFVVGHLGNWKPTAEVLFESNCIKWSEKNKIQKLPRNRVQPIFNLRMSEGARRDIQNRHTIRNLTPKEYERLQGFPDGYTDIKPNGKETPDGHRYKALGNSMAVPVMRWIGERINSYETMRSKAVVQVETGMGLAEV
jgi:DNA (cytosine-5)-methyltransferase 1